MMLVPPEASADTLAPGGLDCDGTLPLRQSLALELEGIRSNVSEWKGPSRSVRWSTKFITWLLKGML
jgi:hypothetical protein